MIIDPSSYVNSTAPVAATVNNTKKPQNSSADTTKFSTLLNQAIQGSATGTTSTTPTANMAELYSLLMQSQINSMLSSTLNSTDSSSSSGLASGLLGGGGSSSSSSLLSLLSTASMLQGAMPTGTNLTSDLLPLLLGSTGNLGGTAGITMIGNQMPLGTLSTPVINIPSTPSITDSSVNSSTSGVSKSTIQDWVNQYAPRYGLSPKLVNAVITQESGYSPSATSSAGAMGLMQLMPETAAMLGVSNPYDPLSNLLGGMSYLGELVNHYHGNISLALAAYNAGSNAVAQYGGIPPYPETQRYVQDIISLMNHA